jgi:hypothetical protein
MTENTTSKTDAKKVKDFTAYTTKTPTNLHVHYTAWLAEKTGFNFSDANEAAKVVQLAVSLYHDYQASDENKARRELETAEKAAASTKAAKTSEQLEAAIAKLQAQLAQVKETPANGSPSATATGEASSKPAGRRSVIKK